MSLNAWYFWNVWMRTALNQICCTPDPPPCGPARYAIIFGPLNIGESNLITAVTVGGPDGCISQSGSPLASMTGPLSASQVAASFAAQTGIPGTLAGPTFIIDAGVTALCCALEEDDLLIDFNGTLRFTPDFDCCPPAPPAPPEPFEPVELVSDWIDITLAGLRTNVITVLHPNPALHFIPLRRGVIKRNTTWSGTGTAVSLGTTANGSESLQAASNLTIQNLVGTTQAQSQLWALPSGTGINLNVVFNFFTSTDQLAKVIIRGMWVPLSVC